MARSDGYVWGLQQYLNDLLLRSYFQTTPADPYIPPNKPIMWTSIGGGAYDFDGPATDYVMLDRRGMLAIWALLQVPVHVRYPTNSIDPEGCMRWGEYDKLWQFFASDTYPTMCEETLTDDGLPYAICFMTQTGAVPVGEVQSGQCDVVVTMGITDPNDITSVWNFLLDGFQPEQTLWRNDGLHGLFVVSDPQKGVKLQ